MSDAGSFQQRMHQDEILVALGGYDALTARLIEQSGGEVVYMSGSSVSTSVHGYPDVGLTTLTEMTRRAKQMATATEIPVFCDADTGYGNPINVMRTVEEFETAGAVGIHIEDQEFPKRCGHFEDKSLIPTKEMTAKIEAATEAREKDDFTIIARTDARAVNGLEAAIERGQRYVDAGADALFIEAPRNESELRSITSAFEDNCPLVANMTEGGKTPMFSANELEAMGYDIVLYPATAFKAAAKTCCKVYNEILQNGTQQNILDLLTSWEERNEITELAQIKQLEDQYST